MGWKQFFLVLVYTIIYEPTVVIILLRSVFFSPRTIAAGLVVPETPLDEGVHLTTRLLLQPVLYTWYMSKSDRCIWTYPLYIRCITQLHGRVSPWHKLIVDLVVMLSSSIVSKKLSPWYSVMLNPLVSYICFTIYNLFMIWTFDL